MTENIQFKVSTSIKTIIGKELVTNPNIAIFELVKNSYDAFASHAWIIFENIRSGINPRIIIVDDGVGMSKRDLVNKWLFVGYSDKRDEEEASNKRRGPLGSTRVRVFAGAKGIGRFSCDTLGASLVLHSKKQGERTINRLDVDWSRFDRDQKEEFQEMNAVYSTERSAQVAGFDLAEMDGGTILELTRLRNDWSDVSQLRDLKRYLQRLVNPYIGQRVSEEFRIEVRAQEFREDDDKARTSPKLGPIINGPVENFIFERLGIKTTSVLSQISKDQITTRLSDKDNLVFELREKNTYGDLHDVDVRIFFLNQSAKQIFTRTMGMSPIEYGSVFLYKNEFRIHPYGDKGDDWLGLEARVGQGYRRYISKRSVIGTVLLRGPQEHFKEVSSRDAGVIKNDAYRQLLECVMQKAIRRLERYVGGVIEWDKASVQGTDDRMVIETKSFDLVSKLVEGTKGPDTTIKVGPALLQVLDAQFTNRYPSILGNLISLREHVQGNKEKTLLDDAINSARRVLAKSERDQSKLVASLAAKEQQNLFLTSALSPEMESKLGHVHSITLAAQLIYSKIGGIRKWASHAGAPPEIGATLEDLRFQVKKILGLAKMATRANFNLSDEEMDGDLVNYIKQYLEHFGRAPKDTLQPIRLYNDNLTFATVFAPVSIAIVLDNLVDNSRKNGASEISIRFEKIGRELHASFGDNGSGIDTQTAEHIFALGYSATGGSGLGLYEVRKIMKDSQGDILFLGNGKKGLGDGACFELIFHER